MTRPQWWSLRVARPVLGTAPFVCWSRKPDRQQKPLKPWRPLVLVPSAVVRLGLPPRTCSTTRSSFLCLSLSSFYFLCGILLSFWMRLHCTSIEYLMKCDADTREEVYANVVLSSLLILGSATRHYSLLKLWSFTNQVLA